MASILFRLLRNFDLDLRHVPTLARRAGVTHVRHRKPSQKIDVFHGTLQLRGVTMQPHFVIGINSAIGGALMSVRTTSMTSPVEITRLTAAAEDWFHEVWTPSVR
jgi:hypothetical protein